ncbi:MAG TPA: hypothetical protein VHV79_11860 [Mycobacteriales bacterium]|jgi:hypothetical protein|nr:hypothetical protein [Mycobacteriales bacterium]
MSARRGLALVLAVLASATVMTSATAATLPAAPSAKPTICVALVVDGRALGSNVKTTCAKVAKGATGIDVLHAGGHTVGFRSDGLLCTIDGLPKSGCASIDDTHYWAYFHRAPGTTKWVYSSEGASTYQPANDSTEGWVYDDGKPLTPDNVAYAAICKPKPKTSTKPSPTSSRSPAPTPSHHPASAPATTAATPIATGTAPASPKRHHHRPAALAITQPSTTSPSPTKTLSPTSAALAGGVKPASNHHGWLDLLLGLIIVAALGISAAARFRRSAR